MKSKLLLLALILSLTSCATVDTITTVGFWHGFWHGLILPFSFVVSLFDENTVIYAVKNNGAWYDFGFVLGLSCLYESQYSLNTTNK